MTPFSLISADSSVSLAFKPAHNSQLRTCHRDGEAVGRGLVVWLWEYVICVWDFDIQHHASGRCDYTRSIHTGTVVGDGGAVAVVAGAAG
jgi:hypothetical protein